MKARSAAHLLQAVLLVGCTQSEAATSAPRTDTETAADSGDALCDGSDEIRLFHSVSPGGAGLLPIYAFTAQYGHRFFAIDGQCHYYARQAPSLPITTGTLSADDAARLSDDVAWTELADWAKQGPQTDGPVCPDSGHESLFTKAGDVDCGSCACSSPVGIREAASNASRWTDRLVEGGTPFTGDVSATAWPDAASSSDSAQDWPLTRAFREIPDLVNTHAGYGQYARFTDAAEVDALRAMRADATGPDGSALVAVDADSVYQVYVRDELPTQVREQIESLRAR